MIIPGILASSKSGHLWAPSQDYVSISTATVDSSGASSITFSGIPSTFTHLQLRIFYLDSTNSNHWIRFNGDTGNNYAGHQLLGDGSAAYATSYTANYGIFLAYSAGSTTAPANGVVDILDYTSTNKNRVTRTLSGFDQNGSGQISLWSGLWLNTTAINSITIFSQSGSFNNYSKFSLYGIK